MPLAKNPIGHRGETFYAIAAEELKLEVLGTRFTIKKHVL